MSSGAYPIIWALKHAPCADVYEQAVLLQMADAADEDGCNAYLSPDTIADRIAGDIDPKTVRRKQTAMAKRGLIRPDTTVAPDRYLKIPRNYRPKRWEICIPFSWWSEDMIEKIQQSRGDRGLPPLTPESRPRPQPAPPKKQRSDKGKPRPKRTQTENRGDSQSPLAKTPTEASGGTLSPPQGGLSVPSRGDSQSPNLPVVTFLNDPPPPPTRDVGDDAAADHAQEPQEEEEEEEEERLTASTNDGQQERPAAALGDLAAHALLGEATRQWVGHRLPTAAERSKLASRIVQALAEGATREGVLHALTRDLAPGQVRTSAVQVVMARTGQTGWAQHTPTVAAPPRPPRPTWCGSCDEPTRLVPGEDGRHRQCPTCHPKSTQQAPTVPLVPPQADAPAQEFASDVAAEIAATKAKLASLAASRR